MNKTPSIMQYLVDLVANSKLKEARDGGDKDFIARQEKYFKDLSESEVKFSPPVKSTFTNGKWQTSMSSPKRGFQISKLTYNTGTLKALTKAVAQAMARKDSLDHATVPGIYLVEENDQIHLLIERDSNIFDALKMTGYEFPADSFKTSLYDVREEELKADGYVDIDHSVVSGRLFVSYIRRDEDEEQNHHTDPQDIYQEDEYHLTAEEEERQKQSMALAQNENNAAETTPANSEDQQKANETGHPVNGVWPEQDGENADHTDPQNVDESLDAQNREEVAHQDEIPTEENTNPEIPTEENTAPENETTGKNDRKKK